MKDLQSLMTQALAVISRALAVLLLVAVAAAVLKWFGVRVPVNVSALELAYVAGAYWLVTRGAA